MSAFTVDVTFRGDPHEVVVDLYADDPETNGCEIEWHFDGVTPDEYEALAVTDAEEQAIVDEIHRAAWDRDAGSDL